MQHVPPTPPLARPLPRLLRGAIRTLAALAFVVGAGAAMLGVVGLLDLPSARAFAARIAALPVMSAREVAASPLGRGGIVEGSVAATNAPRYEQLVAYVLEEGRPRLTRGTGVNWVGRESVTPPLVLTVSNGVARIVNDSYELRATTTTVVVPTNLNEHRRRVRGIVAGDALVVVGTIHRNAHGQGLRAEFVYPGTRDAFVAELHAQVARQSWETPLLIVLGSVLAWAGYRAIMWLERAV